MQSLDDDDDDLKMPKDRQTISWRSLQRFVLFTVLTPGKWDLLYGVASALCCEADEATDSGSCETHGGTVMTATS